VNRFDAIVVGAGPAGAVAAASLAARGYRTALLDRSTFPRDKPCGDYCDPGAVRLIAALGVLPELRAGGAGFIDGMTVVAQDGSAFSLPYPTGRAMLVPRRRLDAMLVDRAVRSGAELREGCRVDRVAVGDRVSITAFGRAEDLRASLLIASDGMRSTVARRLGLLTARPDGRYTVGAYFSGVPGSPAGELHLGPGLYAGVARFGDGTANVCLALARARFRGRRVGAVFADGVRALPQLTEAVAGWTRETPFRVTGPVGFTSHPVLADRVLLAGDAALQIEPITGQGVFFALRSGLLAADEGAAAIAGGAFGSAAMRGYARSRERILGGKLRLLRIVTALALRPRMAPRLVRRLGRDPALAGLLLGATGDVLPPRSVLSLRFLIRLLRAAYAHEA
jgi:flavin-dependent dehydrogenase